jgi:hypothetical protein
VRDQETARQLQVDTARLEHWGEQLGLSAGAKESAGPEFVELAPMPWGQHVPTIAEYEPGWKTPKPTRSGSAGDPRIKEKVVVWPQAIEAALWFVPFCDSQRRALFGDLRASQRA